MANGEASTALVKNIWGTSDRFLQLRKPHYQAILLITTQQISFDNYTPRNARQIYLPDRKVRSLHQKNSELVKTTEKAFEIKKFME